MPVAGARPADGIAFVWKTGTVPGGVGMSGGNMGACSLEGQAVAIDTFELSTPGETRLKLLDTGDAGVCPNNPIASDNTLPNVADGLPHKVEIDVNGQDVRVTLDGKLRLISGWSGRPVFPGFFGFTASTGASASEHVVTDVHVSFPNEPKCP